MTDYPIAVNDGRPHVKAKTTIAGSNGGLKCFLQCSEPNGGTVCESRTRTQGENAEKRYRQGKGTAHHFMYRQGKGTAHHFMVLHDFALLVFSFTLVSFADLLQPPNLSYRTAPALTPFLAFSFGLNPCD
jgi:hypothetical protein